MEKIVSMSEVEPGDIVQLATIHDYFHHNPVFVEWGISRISTTYWLPPTATTPTLSPYPPMRSENSGLLKLQESVKINGSAAKEPDENLTENDCGNAV